MELTTPALLFPAISLLMRELYEEYQEDQDQGVAKQIVNLQVRISLIKYMQICGALSFFFCVTCMFLLFAGSSILANIAFAIALILLLASLALMVRELQLSIDALTVHLSDFSYDSRQDS